LLHSTSSGYDVKKESQAMQTATIEDVQARLPQIVDALAPGEEVVITRDGKPVARLSGPSVEPKGVPIPGRAKGMLIIHADDDEHLKDFAEYMP
jgi:antitoxin (DNA-binding transcriptional repressor) of toxin-antitoxin stability system